MLHIMFLIESQATVVIKDNNNNEETSLLLSGGNFLGNKKRLYKRKCRGDITSLFFQNFRILLS